MDVNYNNQHRKMPTSTSSCRLTGIQTTRHKQNGSKANESAKVSCSHGAGYKGTMALHRLINPWKKEKYTSTPGEEEKKV